MRTIAGYLNNAKGKAIDTIKALANKIPMFWGYEPVEMDYIYVEITVRQEDAQSVENAIAGLV